MENNLEQIVKELQEKYSNVEFTDQLTAIVPKDILLSFMQDLKDNYSFDYLTNLTAADYPADKKSKDDEGDVDEGVMEVVYNLTSIAKGYYFMVKTRVSRQEPELPSVFPVWGGANWQEREVYDLFGIVFTGHPNLKRILLVDNFEGYPLRKDFQWVGGRQ